MDSLTGLVERRISEFKDRLMLCNLTDAKKACKSNDLQAFTFILMVFVELEGVEPSSKQGNNKPSTCLSSLRFSCVSKTEATSLHLILFISSRFQG